MGENKDRPEHDATVRTRRLSDAIRDVKNAAADRSDVLSDLRETRQVRIELLVQELQPIIQDIPEDDALFDLAISSGVEPRLWIDAVSHVHIGRDGRSYRFVRDLRRGREVIAETADVKAMAEHVTFYIAERMVERERIQMEGASSLRPNGPRPALADRDVRDERQPIRFRSEERQEKAAPASTGPADEPKPAPSVSPQSRKRHWMTTALLAVLVILLGMAIGFVVIALFVAPDLLTNLIDLEDSGGVPQLYREISIVL